MNGLLTQRANEIHWKLMHMQNGDVKRVHDALLETVELLRELAHRVECGPIEQRATARAKQVLNERKELSDGK